MTHSWLKEEFIKTTSLCGATATNFGTEYIWMRSNQESCSKSLPRNRFSTVIHNFQWSRGM